MGATFDRRFGAFGGVGEIEAIVVDDELGYGYYADEATGIHKWHADHDAHGADRELALFGTTGYQQDREARMAPTVSMSRHRHSARNFQTVCWLP